MNPQCIIKTLFIFLLATMASTAHAQPPPWQALEAVSYRTRFDARWNAHVDYPVFGPSVLALGGKKIVLKGYMIPLEELSGPHHFVLSRYPFNECYFCGAAGPETVVEIHLSTKEQAPGRKAGPFRFTEEPIRVEGTLRLNDSDPDHLMYLLENARILPD